ncbi:MAG: GTP 3',8-cyclase MoaA [Lachnospiraceae bacterium]|nr:GTP 3',8-cyclase MoaA [Lachnospiraceae bacterium]
MQDGLGRTIAYLRVSVTDRCNLRCRYCMPQEGIEQFAHADCLTLEEIYRIVSVMADMGLKKVRFTGGEPMVRKNLVKLVRDTASTRGIRDVAMTTNGVLFAEHVEEFAQAGLTSVNISLDTLDAETYARITGKDALGSVLAAIEKAVELGLRVKINCVPTRELNGGAGAQADDYLRVAELAKAYPVDVRFIELMPIGCGKQYTRITGDETLRALIERYGPVAESRTMTGAENTEQSRTVTGAERAGQEGFAGAPDSGINGPANYVRFPALQGRIGLIDPMSHQFCATCNRVRLTVDGKLKLCLYYADSLDLKQLLRDGASDSELYAAIAESLLRKPKEHHFLQAGETDALGQTPEMRRMVQIGG